MNANDILIVGAGTAGLTAAIYVQRAGRHAVLFEKGAPGGQIVTANEIQNYPGYSSINGADFAYKLYEQATSLGAEFINGEVLKITPEKDAVTIQTASGTYTGRALIYAAGASHRRLGLANEEKLIGRGISFCANCDGAFFKGKTVAVNGGGNSALQDALLLSDTCSKVYLIHRRDTFRGEAKLVEALKARNNVEFVLGSSITALLGQDELCGIRVADADGNEREIAVDGLFVAIGHAPDNGIFSQLMDLDDGGYADSDESCCTKTPGVFVAGDCRKKTVRQLTTAAADGSAAALAACRYIDALEN